MDSTDRSDIAVLAVLRAISRISLRPWPTDAPIITFHDSFKDDASRVRMICKNKVVFGRTSKYFVSWWDAVNYLASAHFLYYLPAILLAVTEYPKSPLAGILVGYRLPRELGNLSLEEKEAVASVELYLSLRGITRESILREIQEGKELLDRMR